MNKKKHGISKFETFLHLFKNISCPNINEIQRKVSDVVNMSGQYLQVQ